MTQRKKNLRSGKLCFGKYFIKGRAPGYLSMYISFNILKIIWSGPCLLGHEAGGGGGGVKIKKNKKKKFF